MQKLVVKVGSQHGVGRKDDQGRDATSQHDPNDGEQELPHGDLLPAKLPEPAGASVTAITFRAY
jgi:hypothetical protein